MAKPLPLLRRNNGYPILARGKEERERERERDSAARALASQSFRSFSKSHVSVGEKGEGRREDEGFGR